MPELKLKSIPSPSNLPPEVQAFAFPVKEAIDLLLGRVGDGKDAAITRRNAGQALGGTTIINTGTASGGAYVPDLTEPPAPMGLVATPGFAVINLEWDDTPYTVGHGHAYTVVYRSSDAMRGNAVQIGMTPGTIYVDAAGSSAGPFYYWIRFVSRDGVVGSWNAVDGVSASTSASPDYLLGLLAGSIDEGSLKTEVIGGKDAFVFNAKTFAIKYGGTGYVPFIVQTTPAVINGQTIPAGVYLDTAFMRRFVAQAGQIGALAVDDAAIANVSAAKLTIGDGTVGGRLKSAYFASGVAGWQIHPDGTAEFNNVLVHGTVYAESGYFKGTLMGGAATSINAGAGMWAGYESSVYKFRLGAPGSSRMEWTGSALNVYDSNGNITISSGVVDWGRVGGSNKPADNAAAGVVLVNQGGMSITGNTAQKIASSWLYDSGFFSKDGYTGGAYVSWAMSNTTDTVIVGLNTDPAADNSYISIDYGLLCYGDGLLYAFESGNQQGSAIGTRSPGDVYAITYDGSQVRYFQNGFVIRSVSATITGRLYADSSFATSGAIVKNIQFGPLSSNNWASIGGVGKPEDNATYGATIGTNLYGQITSANASTYIANAAIGAAQIGSIALVGTSNFSVKTSASGARMEMDSRVIKVYDDQGRLRVRLGDLSA